MVKSFMLFFVALFLAATITFGNANLYAAGTTGESDHLMEKDAGIPSSGNAHIIAGSLLLGITYLVPAITYVVTAPGEGRYWSRLLIPLAGPVLASASYQSNDGKTAVTLLGAIGTLCQTAGAMLLVYGIFQSGEYDRYQEKTRTKKGLSIIPIFSPYKQGLYLTYRF